MTHSPNFQVARRSTRAGRTLCQTLSILLVLASLVAGCKPGSATAEPPEIRFGVDVCADCGMIISDPRFASAFAREIEPGRYESLAFDDIGDMVTYMNKHQDLPVAGVWAHDFYSEEWIDAETAYYVVSPEIHTPMAHGVAAFADEAQAADLASSYGVDVLAYDYMRIEMLMHNH